MNQLKHRSNAIGDPKYSWKPTSTLSRMGPIDVIALLRVPVSVSSLRPMARPHLELVLMTVLDKLSQPFLEDF